MRYGRAMRNVIGILGALAIVVGPLLAHLGITKPLVGFAIFALGGIVSLLVGLVSIVQALRGRGLTLGGMLGVVAGIAFVAIASRGFGTPRINDFTTDPTDPPAFQDATRIPENAGRDMAYPPDYAAIQRECCADLHPAKLAAPPAQGYERALAVARATPSWTVTRQDGASGTIEAVATSDLFRFQDDIAIRVRPDPSGGSRVDMRSKSRDGKGDIGANTTRIRAFVSALEAGR
jgi:uncharacterized protein (DUF1499 family)